MARNTQLPRRMERHAEIRKKTVDFLHCFFHALLPGRRKSKKLTATPPSSTLFPMEKRLRLRGTKAFSGTKSVAPLKYCQRKGGDSLPCRHH